MPVFLMLSAVFFFSCDVDTLIACISKHDQRPKPLFLSDESYGKEEMSWRKMEKVSFFMFVSGEEEGPPEVGSGVCFTCISRFHMDLERLEKRFWSGPNWELSCWSIEIGLWTVCTKMTKQWLWHVAFWRPTFSMLRSHTDTRPQRTQSVGVNLLASSRELTGKTFTRLHASPNPNKFMWKSFPLEFLLPYFSCIIWPAKRQRMMVNTHCQFKQSTPQRQQAATTTAKTNKQTTTTKQHHQHHQE